MLSRKSSYYKCLVKKKTITVKSSGHNIRFEGFIFYKSKKNQVHIYFTKTITKISYVEVFNLCSFSHL